MVEARRADDAVLTWRAPVWARCAAAAAGARFLLWAAATLYGPPAALHGRAERLLRGSETDAFLVGAVRCFRHTVRSRIILTRDAVIVRNALRTHRIALADLDTVAGAATGPRIWDADPRTVKAGAAPFSLAARRGEQPGRSRQIAHLIEAAAQRAHDQ